MAQSKKNKELNDQQKLFAEEYVNNKGLNGTAAAIAAEYSEKTACSQASTLLRNPKVKKYIAELKARRAKITGVDAAWLLRHLAQEVIADVNDLYDEDNNIKPVKEWPLIWRQGLVAGIESGPLGITKLKLANRARIKELLGKHVDIGAFADKLDVSGTITLESIVATANQDKAIEAEVIPIKAVNDKD